MKNIEKKSYQIIKDSIGRMDCSNCVESLDTILLGLEKGRIQAYSTNPVILIEKKRGYNQLFYFLDKNSPLSEWSQITEQFSNESLFADIVVKGKFNYENSIFYQLNLKPYKTYLRKSVKNFHKEYRELLPIVYAEQEDCTAIDKMLTKTFDVMSDHIPEKEELKQLIEQKQVLMIKVQDTVSGVLLFEDIGIRSYVRCLCVSQEYQNNAMGYGLFTHYFNIHRDKTKLFYLWVDEANDSVKKLHHQFGYQEDGLRNYIFRGGKLNYGRENQRSY